jgi:dihydroneopterin aldolase
MDELFINDLKIHTIIGILPFERHQIQAIYLDLCLRLALSNCGETDDLASSIDYTLLVRDLELWTQARKARLIESLAEHLCAQILEHYPSCAELTLSVRKPSAISQAKEAGIRLTRKRAHDPTPATYA